MAENFISRYMSNMSLVHEVARPIVLSDQKRYIHQLVQLRQQIESAKRTTKKSQIGLDECRKNVAIAPRTDCVTLYQGSGTPPQTRKKRLVLDIGQKQEILQFTLKNPKLSQSRVANIFTDKFGVFIAKNVIQRLILKKDQVLAISTGAKGRKMVVSSLYSLQGHLALKNPSDLQYGPDSVKN